MVEWGKYGTSDSSIPIRVMVVASKLEIVVTVVVMVVVISSGVVSIVVSVVPDPSNVV